MNYCSGSWSGYTGKARKESNPDKEIIASFMETPRRSGGGFFYFRQ